MVWGAADRMKQPTTKQHARDDDDGRSHLHDLGLADAADRLGDRVAERARERAAGHLGVRQPEARRVALLVDLLA